MRVKRNFHQGFTLLEVIVALAVVAIALSAGVAVVSGSTRNAAGLQDRTYAHWVAMNKMTELQVTRQWPEIGTATGSELMARHEWHWTINVSSTPNEFIRRVDISVRAEQDDKTSLVTLTGFLGQS